MKVSSRLLCWLAISAYSQNPVVAGPLSINGMRVNKDVTPWIEIRDRHSVRQKWDYSCGAAALATVLQYQYSEALSEKEIVETLLATGNREKIMRQRGFSLLDLKRYAQRRGYSSAGYADLNLETLQAFGLPVIVLVNLMGFNHFVVFRGAKHDHVFVVDPAWGNTTLRVDAFLSSWQGRIGFVIQPRDDRMTLNHLAVRDEEMIFVDQHAVARSSNRWFPWSTER
jgi:uncharacterized protein